MGLHVGRAQLEAWGQPSISANLLKSVVTQIATLYRVQPIVDNRDAAPEALDWLAEHNVFSRHKRLNRMTVGLRDCLARVHWTDDGPEVEVVTPDFAYVKASPKNPTRPTSVWQAAKRQHPLRPTETIWTWEAWDLDAPNGPTYRILAENGKTDLSRAYGVDPVYPWVTAEGEPFLPWVLYHAEDSGHLFDPDGWAELVDGTYMVAMLFTFWLHIVRNASWSQAYGLDVDLRGTRAAGSGDSNRKAIATDPKSLLMFDSKAGSGGQLGALAVPADPAFAIKAIIEASDWILAQIGITSAEVQAAQSGVALTVRRESVVRLQQEYLPSFRKGDLELLTVIAKVTNRFSGPDVPALPYEGWRIAYPSAPVTRDEVVDRLDSLLKQVDAGLMSRSDIVMQMNPGMSRDAALEELARIDAEKNGVTAATEGAGDLLAMLADAIRTGDDPRDIVEDLAEMLGVDVPEMPEDEPTAEEADAT
jgi:hypothetical protein